MSCILGLTYSLKVSTSLHDLGKQDFTEQLSQVKNLLLPRSGGFDFSHFFPADTDSPSFLTSMYPHTHIIEVDLSPLAQSKVRLFHLQIQTVSFLLF